MAGELMNRHVQMMVMTFKLLSGDFVEASDLCKVPTLDHVRVARTFKLLSGDSLSNQAIFAKDRELDGERQELREKIVARRDCAFPMKMLTYQAIQM